ncbi:MAG: hypothetical protein PQJ44_06080 [Sphaerochaetaceae bacterium]|nr:hypothetical protein [Sphaerochaetaceae bacterium]
MNKGLITNLIAILIVFIGALSGEQLFLMMGLFALSGAITNSIAIHMLFEKVPLLYGSGVIEDRFEQFKSGIHGLIMEQFFTKENLDRFLSEEFHDDKKHFDFSKLISQTDFSPAYESLKSAVMESQFGSMLGMFGGEKALEPLEKPFKEKLKGAITKIVHTDGFQKTLHDNLKSKNISDDIVEKVDAIVQRRLDEMTPIMVKEIIQKIIKEHLGWLVVWGGVFGGAIGALSAYWMAI